MNETWYDYRTVWASNAWVVVLAIGGALMVVVGLVGTFVVPGPLALFFIPGLAVLLMHHLVVRKKIG